MMSIDRLPWHHKAWKGVREIELPDDMFLEQWTVPKGTKIKMTETTNFGWVVLPKDTKSKEGYTIPRRIFKF